MKEILKIDEISILGASESMNASLNNIFDENGVKIYDFKIAADVSFKARPITLQWKIPTHNIKGVWKPTTDFAKRIQADWELDHMESRISIDAPVISLFGHNDENRHTFACSNAINKLELNARIREEDDCFYCFISFFTERNSKIKDYEVQLRIDTGKKHFSSALKQTATWWESFDNLKPSYVPEIAKAPLYSTWYQFHQNLDVNELIIECKIAKQLGFESIIIDDGWQTNDSNRGYDYTGDWLPERITKTKEFVEAIHAIGMKVGFWYSVPFCGKKSEAYQKFKGKFLTEEHRWAPVFDPRFPEVREYLIDIYKRALIDWKLDGFKLDFIDDFKLYPDTEINDLKGRDYVSINEAVDRLLTDVKKTLTDINPDIFIEFRQKYTGPAMRKYGNMFRAFDCPGDTTMNRVRIADIRMLAGNTAVHSDMITWHKDEKLEVAALQLINTFFGVPQISVKLKEISKEQLEMVAFYTNYWNKHKDIFTEGNFIPYKPLANYPIQKVAKNENLIIGLYDEYIVRLEHAHKYIDILNAQLATHMIINVAKNMGDYQSKIYDCTGNLISQNELILNGLIEFKVPACGILQLTQI